MKIELEGYNLDELIKVLYRKKVTLTNICKIKDNYITFEIEDKDHKKVKKYILNYKVKTILSKFKQLPKLIVANLGIVLGLFFGSLFMVYASCFTWQIKVYGIEELTYNEIITVLANNGIKKGKINHISSEDIETILLNNYNRIAQVSVIKQGTAIIINLSEKLVYNNTEYAPITAKYNGIITQTNILTGTTNVKVGDYVNIGDVLVLPFNITASGERVSVKPMAEIKAKIFVVGSCSLSKTEQVLTRTGKSVTTYNYQLFNFNIFSGKNKNSFAQFEQKVYNEKVSDLIPFKRTKTVYYELAITEKTNDLLAEQDALKQKSHDLAQSKLPAEYTLIDESSSTTIVDDTLHANTIITINGIVN